MSAISATEVLLREIQRELREIQREVRDGLHMMQLRDDQREASYQTMIRTLTSQMVHIAGEVEARMAGFDQRQSAFGERLDRVEVRLDRIEGHLDGIEVLLADISRKLA